jgi:hypothetical protein
MMALTAFTRSCGDAALYPGNLLHPSAYDHELKAYNESLRDHKERLFLANESSSSVTVLQYDETRKGAFAKGHIQFLG